MTILEAAAQLIPGTAWNLDGDVLSQADDGTSRVPIPDMAELQALVDKDAYREKRAKEYPPIPDQLGAIWAGGQEYTDMETKIIAVKNKYPKA